METMLLGRREPPIASEVRRVVEEHELTLEGAPMPEAPAERTAERRRKGRQKSEAKRTKKRTQRECGYRVIVSAEIARARTPRSGK